MCITSLYIRFSIYRIYFYVHHMIQCTVVLLLLEVIIFCSVAAVTPRHAGSATCLLDEAICCFRVGGCSFGQSGPGDFRLCHDEKRFSHEFVVEFAIDEPMRLILNFWPIQNLSFRAFTFLRYLFDHLHFFSNLYFFYIVIL